MVFHLNMYLTPKRKTQIYGSDVMVANDIKMMNIQNGSLGIGTQSVGFSSQINTNRSNIRPDPLRNMEQEQL